MSRIQVSLGGLGDRLESSEIVFRDMRSGLQKFSGLIKDISQKANHQLAHVDGSRGDERTMARIRAEAEAVAVALYTKATEAERVARTAERKWAAAADIASVFKAKAAKKAKIAAEAEAAYEKAKEAHEEEWKKEPRNEPETVRRKMASKAAGNTAHDAQNEADEAAEDAEKKTALADELEAKADVAADKASKARSELAKHRVPVHEIPTALHKEADTLESFDGFLFDAQQLELNISLYDHFSEQNKKVFKAVVSVQWDALRDLLRGFNQIEDANELSRILDIIRSGNQSLRDLTREHLLDSSIYQDLDILKKLSINITDSTFNSDVQIRMRNMQQRPELFPPVPKERLCKVCGADPDTAPEHLDGKCEKANRDFLTFPGRLNNIKLEPIVDTGSGLNIIKAEWLKENNINFVRDPEKYRIMKYADGSVSGKCYCIDVKWSFDGTNKIWRDVEFVIVPGFRFTALIGLPFMKHTQMIHNSNGAMLFPEFQQVHSRREAIPVYSQTNDPPGKL